MMFSKISRKLNLLDILAKSYDHSLSGLLEHYENAFIDPEAYKKAQYPPVFIIGAPRTGSTFLYQLLTYYLDVNYIDNFIHIFNKHLLAGFHWSNKIFKNKPHESFTSKFGKTAYTGWRAPSECAMFWYRFLPKNYHYIPKGYMPEKVINYYNQKIYSVILDFPKPFVIKNLNAGQRLGFISEFAPDARFIFIRREPVDTALSILHARKKNRIKPHEWWSVKPAEFEKLTPLQEEEMVVAQVHALEQQIKQDKNYFPPGHFLEINFSDLCNHPQEIMEKIQSFLGDSINLRKGADFKKIKILNTMAKKNKEEKARISQIVNQYHWQ